MVKTFLSRRVTHATPIPSCPTYGGMWHGRVFPTALSEAKKYFNSDLLIFTEELHQLQHKWQEQVNWQETVHLAVAIWDIVESHLEPLDMLFPWERIERNQYREVSEHILTIRPKGAPGTSARLNNADGIAT